MAKTEHLQTKTAILKNEINSNEAESAIFKKLLALASQINVAHNRFLTGASSEIIGQASSIDPKFGHALKPVVEQAHDRISDLLGKEIAQLFGEATGVPQKSSVQNADKNS